MYTFFMNLKNGLAPLALVFILAVLVGGGYFLVSKKLKVESIKKEVTTEQSDVSTKDWKTYRNGEYGFEFRYPRDWDVKKLTDNGVVLIFRFASPDFMETEVEKGIITRGKAVSVRIFKERIRKSIRELNDEVIDSGNMTGIQNTHVVMINNQRISYDFAYKGVSGHALHILADSFEIEIGILARSIESKLEIRKLFDDIISTLQFTDKKSAGDSSH